ncbi:glycerate dehydrogenase-like protein [Bacillus phage Shbh1]|uniref:Glycerate dehydrogenase-like protein n=1 Tax=Bacillus phage Shbh1 TaxID=1796992 RepID=A0A142F163_9CAUD|nr:glycerate dehydrogenase-like protein [Bacillus phage Shbh1]AMQ66520.1 glycerate dehydrogenase-like protein [Bacillus phage Shbh1]
MFRLNLFSRRGGLSSSDYYSLEREKICKDIEKAFGVYCSPTAIGNKYAVNRIILRDEDEKNHLINKESMKREGSNDIDVFVSMYSKEVLKPEITMRATRGVFDFDRQETYLYGGVDKVIVRIKRGKIKEVYKVHATECLTSWTRLVNHIKNKKD